MAGTTALQWVYPKSPPQDPEIPLGFMITSPNNFDLLAGWLEKIFSQMVVVVVKNCDLPW